LADPHARDPGARERDERPCPDQHAIARDREREPDPLLALDQLERPALDGPAALLAVDLRGVVGADDLRPLRAVPRAGLVAALRRLHAGGRLVLRSGRGSGRGRTWRRTRSWPSADAHEDVLALVRRDREAVAVDLVGPDDGSVVQADLVLACR